MMFLTIRPRCPSTSAAVRNFAAHLLFATTLCLVASPGDAHDRYPHKPLVVASSPLVAQASSSATASTPTPAPVAADPAQADALTQSLIDVGAQYRLATPAGQRDLESSLLATAATRRQVLASLMEDDPGAVLDAALPASVRAMLPSSLAAYLEKDAEVDGTLEILHEDSNSGSRYRYFLHAKSARYSLHFASRAPDYLLTGTAIRVKGVQVENMLALSGDTDVQQLAAAPVPQTFGEQRTLVILVNFSDAPVQPYTPADARNVMFGTTSQFYLENSSQQTWLSGDVVGWFPIATTSTVCDTESIAAQAESAATAAGVNVAAYAHKVYAFPQNYNCYFWGRSSVGGAPSQAWINGKFELGVTAHEFGHGMGLWHSHSMECGADTLGATCSASEYGDMFDMMGSSSFAHFNAFQKEQLGWLNYGASPPITTVQSAGTYVLDAYELAGSGPKALKILKSTDPSTGKRTWYYVQSRQAIGFDAGLAGNSNVLGGVLIHFGTESNGNSAYLVDLTPASGSTTYLDWSDPALTVGKSYTDPQTGMTITPNWVTGTAAAVTVSFGASGTGVATLTVKTDKTSYTRTQSVSIQATVTSAGAPVANATVTFKVKRPTGVETTASAITGSTGVAVWKMKLSRKDPIGVYEADAAALSTSAATNFTVQ